MMGIFRRNRKRQEIKKDPDKKFDGEKNMDEGLSELVALEEPRSVNRAVNEADAAARVAMREEITRLRLIEQGCCPECRMRIENFVFTQICPACGWFRRISPDSGHCIVHMNTGTNIKCDRVFPVKGNQFLCVVDGIVRSQVMRSNVLNIEYIWEDEELASIRKTFKKRLQGICSWCDKPLQDTETKEPLEEYVAFGAFQERYIFCSVKCIEAFRKQYSSRIHRNCYETNCNSCEKCIKRYDSSGFKRFTLIR